MFRMLQSFVKETAAGDGSYCKLKACVQGILCKPEDSYIHLRDLHPQEGVDSQCSQVESSLPCPLEWCKNMSGILRPELYMDSTADPPSPGTRRTVRQGLSGLWVDGSGPMLRKPWNTRADPKNGATIVDVNFYRQSL
jgi:hypothetical protein